MRTTTMRRRKNFWPIFLSLLPVFVILAGLRIVEAQDGTHRMIQKEEE